ncbi:unnamed protein product [Arctogadus glacialis]
MSVWCCYSNTRKEADRRPLDSSHSGRTGLRPAGRGVGGRLLSISDTTAATAPPGLLPARLLLTWPTPHASCPPQPGGGALLEAGSERVLLYEPWPSRLSSSQPGAGVRFLGVREEELGRGGLEMGVRGAHSAADTSSDLYTLCTPSHDPVLP